ncbi:MAG: oligosaccharide flippase family protein [Candidatus Micrarchaeia archaeon]
MEAGYEESNITNIGIKSVNVTSFVIFGKIFAIIVSGITFLIVARLLGPSNYGIYILALAAAGLFGSFSQLNIGAYFNKNIPHLLLTGKRDEIALSLGNGFVLLGIFSIVVVIIGVAFSGPIATYIFHNSSATDSVALAMFTIIFSLVYTTAYSILISFNDGKRLMFLSVTNNSMQSAFTISLVLLGFGVFGAISGLIIGLFAAMLLSLFYIEKRSKIAFSLDEFRRGYRKLLSFSVPLTGAGIIGSLLGNFAVVFLGAVATPVIIGSYGVASKIGALIDILTGSIGVVLVPTFSTTLAHTNIKNKIGKVFNYSVYFGLLFAMPIIMYLVAFSNILIPILFTSSYSDASLYMALISIGILIGIVGAYSSSLMVSYGKLKELFKYTAISCAIQLVFILLLVPKFYAVGLILATFILGSIVSDYLLISYMRKSLGIRLGYNIARLIAVNFVLFAIFVPVVISGIGGIPKLAIGIVLLLFVYPALLGSMRAISHYEISVLNNLSSGIPVFGTWLKAILAYASMFAK